MDEAGGLIASAGRDYPTLSLHAGWAEQNPDHWLDALRGALNELKNRDPLLMQSLDAIGFCSAAHIPVPLDNANEVIRPAILWSDQRSVAEVANLSASHSTLLEETTLNGAGCTWTLPQLLWVAKHEPDSYARVRSLLSSKDYLIFRLTGKMAMDHASAAATLMLEARAKTWSPQVVALSKLPQSAFPLLVNPMAIVGKITSEAAREFGLRAGTAVIAGTLDSAAEMLGCGLLAPGESGMIRVGSVGGIMAVTDRPTFNRGIITYPHVIDGLFYKQAGTNACATSLKWIRDLCMKMRGADAPQLTYENLDRLATDAKSGADGLMFHPYIQGERAPYWNPDLRGSFTGIDQRHGWPQFIRAVMEGVAFSLRDCLTMFRREGLDITSAVMAGGIVKSQIWSQIITDVLDMKTHMIRNGDSALGACMLAATAVGMFDDINEAVSICVKQEQTVIPNGANSELYDRLFARYQEVGKFLDALDRK